MFRQNFAALISCCAARACGAFHPVVIRLTDLDTTVSVSVVDGFTTVAAPADVSMHPSSLSFCSTTPSASTR